MKKAEGKGREAEGKKKVRRKPRKGTVLDEDAWAIVSSTTGELLTHLDEFAIYPGLEEAEEQCAKEVEHVVPVEVRVR